MKTIVSISTAILLLSFITHPSRAANLESFLTEFGQIELGISEKAFTKRFPDAASMKLPQKASPSMEGLTAYQLETGFPLSKKQIFNFKNGKLASVNCMDPQTLFSSGWEGADALVRWGKETVRTMQKLWGAPTEAKVKTSRHGGSSQVFLKWKRPKSTIITAFSPPASLLENSGRDQNLNGMFLLWKTAPDSQDANIPPGSPEDEREEDYHPALLEADYETFRKRMEVTPVPDSSNFLPEEIQTVYLGMETSELKKRRPKADDFFNERWNFFEYLEGSKFFSVNYRARMDRLVKISLLPSKDQASTPEKLGAIVNWCLKNWGDPAEILIPEPPKNMKEKFKSQIYLWNHENIKTALKIDIIPTPFVQITIMEKKMPLTCVVPTSFTFTQKALNAADLEALKTFKFWQ